MQDGDGFNKRKIGFLIAAAVLILVSLASVVAYLGRNAIAQWYGEHLLSQYGVEGQLNVDSLDSDGIVANIRIGSSSSPDLVIERADIRFHWHGFAPDVQSVEIDGIELKGRLSENGANFGSVSQLWHSLSARPRTQPFSIASLPAISVRHADVLLTSTIGTARIRGDAEIASGGRLRRLDLSASPLRLATPRFDVSLTNARVRARSDAFDVSLDGDLSADIGPAQARLGSAHIELSGKNISMDMRANGLAVAALVDSQISAAQGQIGDALFDRLVFAATAKTVFDGTSRFRVDMGLNLDADLSRQTSALLKDVVSRFTRDPAILRAAKRLSALRFGVPDVTVVKDSTLTVFLPKPATLNAGGLTLAVAGSDVPMVVEDAGAISGAGSLRLSGSGLPSLDLAVRSITFRENDIRNGRSQFAVASSMSLGGLQSAHVALNGYGVWSEKDVSIFLDRCASLAADSFSTGGKIRASRISTAICGVRNRPLFSLGSDGLDLHARLRELSMVLPPASVRVSDARGVLEYAMGRDGSHAALTIANAALSDVANIARFQPVELAGRMNLAGTEISGRIVVSQKGKELGTADIRSTARNPRGKAILRSASLEFDPSGLRPSSLSPLLSSLREAKGSARFDGKISWAPGRFTSEGMLAIDNLDFLGPTGVVHDAETRIRFDSLVPLRTAPDQQLSASQIATAVPLRNLQVTFALDGTDLGIAAAKADVAKGEASLGPLAVSLSNRTTSKGVLNLGKIDLAPLLDATNLSRKIDAKIAVSGTIPFQITAKGPVITNGHIASVGGGTLSIDPSLWTGGQAGVETNAVRSFAYQALENLQIETLEGDLNSRPGGRLELVLHIKGRHAPPTPKSAEIGVFDLLNGTAFQQRIPLPSGTEVNLTLDTTLNFAELLASYESAWAQALDRASQNREMQ